MSGIVEDGGGSFVVCGVDFGGGMTLFGEIIGGGGSFFARKRSLGTFLLRGLDAHGIRRG